MSVAEITRAPQSILRDWVRGLVDDGESELSVALLLPRAQEQFARDPEFAHALVVAVLPGLLSEAVRKTLGVERQAVKIGLSTITQEALDELVVAKLSRWFENSHNSTHTSLMELTRPEIRYAVEQRKQQVRGHILAVKFLEELAAGLRSDKQTIGERYSESQLVAIARKYYGREIGQ